MKARRIVPLIFTIGIVGCSWLTNLIIVNKTDEPVTLTYYLKLYEMRPKEGEPCCPKVFRLESPMILPPDSFTTPRNDFPAHTFNFDNTTGEVTTVIPPGKAIWIDRISNYSGARSTYEFYYSHMNIKKLIITSKDRTITYQGV